jgi:hypothetical protein
MVERWVEGVGGLEGWRVVEEASGRDKRPAYRIERRIMRRIEQIGMMRTLERGGLAQDC